MEENPYEPPKATTEPKAPEPVREGQLRIVNLVGCLVLVLVLAIGFALIDAAIVMYLRWQSR